MLFYFLLYITVSNVKSAIILSFSLLYFFFSFLLQAAFEHFSLSLVCSSFIIVCLNSLCSVCWTSFSFPFISASSISSTFSDSNYIYIYYAIWYSFTRGCVHFSPTFSLHFSGWKILSIFKFIIYFFSFCNMLSSSSKFFISCLLLNGTNLIWLFCKISLSLLDFTICPIIKTLFPMILAIYLL